MREGPARGRKGRKILFPGSVISEEAATCFVLPLNLIWKSAVNPAPVHTKQSRSLRDVAARLFRGALNQQLFSSIQIQWMVSEPAAPDT
jgi:hypothetical protein